jgi:hypothetical protein
MEGLGKCVTLYSARLTCDNLNAVGKNTRFIVKKVVLRKNLSDVVLVACIRSTCEGPAVWGFGEL